MAMASEIARLRAVHGLSQQQLAEKAGTSQPQIKRLEDGTRKLTTQWAERLAPHLKVTAQALLFPKAPRRTNIDSMLADLPPEIADELQEEFERRVMSTRRLIEGRR